SPVSRELTNKMPGPATETTRVTHSSVPPQKQAHVPRRRRWCIATQTNLRRSATAAARQRRTVRPMTARNSALCLALLACGCRNATHDEPAALDMATALPGDAADAAEPIDPPDLYGQPPPDSAHLSLPATFNVFDHIP